MHGDLMTRRPLGMGMGLHNPYQLVPVRCGTDKLPIDRNMLDSYLPMAGALVRQGVNVNMDQIIRHCVSVQSGDMDPLKMQAACQQLLYVLKHHSHSPQEAHFALTAKLEQMLMRGHLRSVCKLFLCFADLSRTTKSRPLSNVLHSFFTKNGDDIIRSSAPIDVISWGCAIMISRMVEPQKLDCIHIILKACPELMLGNAYIGYSSELIGTDHFIAMMHRVAQLDDELLLEDRGRQRFRDHAMGHRRFSGNRLGPWRNDLLSLGRSSDIFDDMGGRRADWPLRPQRMVQTVKQLQRNQADLEEEIDQIKRVLSEVAGDGLSDDYDELEGFDFLNGRRHSSGFGDAENF